MREVDVMSLYDNELNTWVRKEGELYIIGITNWAQEFMGGITMISDLPTLNQRIDKKTVMVNIESDKASTEVIAPIIGEVIEINYILSSRPSLINSDCYGDGWMLKVKRAKGDNDSNLISALEYKNAIGTFFRKG